jgi:hypothetical protein
VQHAIEAIQVLTRSTSEGTDSPDRPTGSGCGASASHAKQPRQRGREHISALPLSGHLGSRLLGASADVVIDDGLLLLDASRSHAAVEAVVTALVLAASGHPANAPIADPEERSAARRVLVCGESQDRAPPRREPCCSLDALLLISRT